MSNEITIPVSFMNELADARVRIAELEKLIGLPFDYQKPVVLEANETLYDRIKSMEEEIAALREQNDKLHSICYGVGE